MKKSVFPQTVLITGATGGIGGALAEVYAEPGNTLILQGRNHLRLAKLSVIGEAQGAGVLIRTLDLRNLDELKAWLREMCQKVKVDLLIVNAGVNTNVGHNGDGESWEAVDELIDVNIKAAMATVNTVLPFMRDRGIGQIALMSSLAAYHGLPVTPSYSASKAALKAYGESLRGWLAPEGIRVNVVMPGYVDSKMCREMPGPKPFIMSPERAARYIKNGLNRNQPRISFPFPLNFGTWWLSVLPSAISLRILRMLNYGG